MSLETAFQENFQAQGWANPAQHGLVAVSTGVDSMVLLQLLLSLPDSQRPQLTVLHVNHHLREQSRTEAAFLKDWCQERQIPFIRADWPADQHPVHGTEVAARQFRYQFFKEQLVAQSADWVATAHQANEQVETVLLKLIRGGTLSQLTGIEPSRPLGTGQVIHPLLPFQKATLQAYAREHHIPWYEDVTNQELTVSRNRVRHEILPLLQQENPQVGQHLLAYAQQLQATLTLADQALDQQLAAIVTQSDPLTANIVPLLAQPLATQHLLLTRLVKRVAPQLSTKPAILDQCCRLLANEQRPTGTVAFADDWVCYKSYTQFQFLQLKNFQQKSVEHFSFMVDLDQWRSVGNGWQFGCFTASHLQENTPHETVALTADQLPLMVRSWQSGDQLRLASGHHQTVRRALINAKVPRQLRSRQAVLVTATGDVLAVLGVKWSVWPRRSHTKNYHVVWKHE